MTFTRDDIVYPEKGLLFFCLRRCQHYSRFSHLQLRLPVLQDGWTIRGLSNATVLSPQSLYLGHEHILISALEDRLLIFTTFMANPRSKSDQVLWPKTVWLRLLLTFIHGHYCLSAIV